MLFVLLTRSASQVNVLNEIPYLVRKALSSITGTKPYIFQVSLISNPCQLSLPPDRLVRHDLAVPQRSHSERHHRRRRVDTRQGLVVQRGHFRLSLSTSGISIGSGTSAIPPALSLLFGFTIIFVIAYLGVYNV